MSEAADVLSTGGWPLRLLTLADWDALPEDELHHVEVSEGVLVVVPNPHPRHQNAVAGLLTQLRAQLPRHLVALPECDVILSEDPLTVRGPDVLVVTADAYRSGVQAFRADDLRLAVEVVSPGSRRMDRVTKASEYAEAGIPTYWVVELDDTQLETFGVSATTYVALGAHRGVAEVEVAGAPLTIDLDALTAT